jgi:glycosyltransferase involved in cell wall biosynthesis
MVVNKKVRILHLRTVSGTGGGPDKTILKSCKYLSSAGKTAEAFYILNRDRDTGVLQSAAKTLGVTMHTVMENGPISILTLWALGQVLRNGNYDIVHTHDYKSNVLAGLFRTKYRYKIVATAHGYNPTTRRELLYYQLERWIFKYVVHAVIAPTQDMQQKLHGFGINMKKLHIIPNGIETNGRQSELQLTHQPSRSSNRQVQLLYIGRLSEEKNLENLLRAVVILREENIAVKLMIAGDGPSRRQIENNIAEWKLADNVSLAGFVSDVNPLLKMADIVVNPSRTECMPNSILEAMLAGVPVVATDVGGVREMIRDQVDGLLCPPENSAALAEAIKKLILNPTMAKNMAASAHERVVNEFTFEKHMEKTLEIYRQILMI